MSLAPDLRSRAETLGQSLPALLAEALRRTWTATPDPKWVIASGDCAIDGGVFAGSYACIGAVENVIPVSLRIRGCPPTPLQLLEGLLALLAQADRR